MFEPLLGIEQCPPGRSVFVCHHGKELAVYHLQDPPGFVVSDNSCPHAGGNLSAGTLHRSVVLCPVHRWKFDLLKGYCVGTSDVFLKRYACKVDGQTLLVDLEQPVPVTPPPPREF